MARPNSSSNAEAVIAEGTHVRGRVTGEGSLRVQGRIEGNVTLRGDLHVAASGQLVSSVEASTITIEGDVEGSVSAASGSVSVAAGARLVGDVQAARFQLEEGGEFAGNLAHDFDLPAELGTPSARGSNSTTSPRRR